MGYFDQLSAYIKANTPRSTRQVASPAAVLNAGLLNPNQYNAPTANRFKDSAFGLLGIIPGAGDYASGAQAADYFNRGEKLAGAMSLLGALPVIPSIGGMFIGKGAKTWDALKAQQAEELLAKGVDPRDVWRQTGTMRGVDNAFRQEIPDNAISFNDKLGRSLLASELMGGLPETTAGQIMPHQMLSEAYPGIEGTVVVPSPSASSSYSMGRGVELAIDPRGQGKSPLLHELQHAIQQREGWARGGSPAEFAHGYKQQLSDLEAQVSQINAQMREAMGTPKYNELMDQRSEIVQHIRNIEGADGLGILESANNDYRRLAGEAEARLTQARMNMTMPERLQSYPYDMLDVPQEHLIIRGLLGR